MKLKSQLMTTEEITRALKRIAHQITEKNHGISDIALLGIKRGGIPIALRLAENLENIEDAKVPVGILDITHFRDDLTEIPDEPKSGPSEIDFDINGKHIILVDDVLCTGRTARAALDAVSRLGRAKSIQFAVLIDRGHKELPIRADYVGKNVPTSHSETVAVEFNAEPIVNLYEKSKI